MPTKFVWSTYVNMLVSVCGYHALHTLDLNFQRLLLFEQLLQLRLSGSQYLIVLGLYHLDVFKLEKKKQVHMINTGGRETPEPSLTILQMKHTLLWYHSSVSFRFFSASLSYCFRTLLSITARSEFLESISTFTSESLIFSRRASTSYKRCSNKFASGFTNSLGGSWRFSFPSHQFVFLLQAIQLLLHQIDLFLCLLAVQLGVLIGLLEILHILL